MSPLRIGTRRSALAVAQANLVADDVHAVTGRAVELIYITTDGDVSAESLRTLGGTGVFVNALRESLLARQIDIAVHSLKDLPTAPVAEIELIAVPARSDARDALCARQGLTLQSLPAGSTVGTGSPRRAVQLKLLRPDFEIVDIRGNVDTRLGMVADGSLDAVVLAQAGLSRLGRLDVITQTLDPALMLPAPGQGALAVEVCCDSPETGVAESLRTLDDAPTRAAVTAERAVLSELEAGCSAPVGALAVADMFGTKHAQLHLEALLASPDGSTVKRLSITASPTDADAAGRQLAGQLLGAGVVVS